MKNIEEITSCLLEKLSPNYIRIINDSEKHQGHQKNLPTLSHIHLTIISEKFNNLSRVKRQQYVYQQLKKAFELGLHACQLITKTKDEYHVK